VTSINKKIKAEDLGGNFKELKKYNDEYDKRFYKRIVCQKNNLKKLFGNNGIHFILKSLQRSRHLYLGLFDCLNVSNLTLSFLVTRAHFEVTGSVAYFLWNLTKYYDGKIREKELDSILRALLLGGRTFPEKDKYPHRPDAINVLTQINTADKVFAQVNSGKNLKMFRECYDFLSEACHPNFLGLTFGSEEFDGGTITFQKKIDIGNGYLKTIIPHMLISCAFFFHVYDKSFTQLKENEIIPDLYK